MFIFSPLSSPLVLDSFHLPLSLEHCLTVHLFSLCMLSLPPLFTFISRLLFLFNSPWFSLSFSVLPISSAALPFSPLAFQPKMLLGGLFPIRSVLSCLLEFPSPLYRSHLFFIYLFFHLLIRSQVTTSSLLLVLLI